MIVKTLKANSTKGTILYAGQKINSELIFTNDCFGSPKQLVIQFRQVQELNNNANEKNKTFHAIISLPEEDKYKLNTQQEIEIVKAYAKKQGLEKNQWIAYKHNDTKYPHFHFIANRINADTAKSISLSNDRFKNMAFSESMEVKYNLFVLDRKLKKDKSKTNLRIKELKQIVDNNIKNSKDFNEFIKNMKKDNVTVNKGRGLSYTHNKVSIKGSCIGRNYSLKNTEKQILENSDKKSFRKKHNL